MKIGILTVPFNNNYGGFLQAFALKRVLMDMGHQIIFINRRPNRMISRRTRIRDLLRNLLFLKDKQKKISKYTDKFQRMYLFPYTSKYFSSNDLKKCLKYRFDCIIVGSDQVWRYTYFTSWIDDFFCNFLEETKIPHFSYAASMGTDELEYSQQKIDICAKLLKGFNAISVREESSVKMLQKHFGVDNVQVVLDPTLLLDKRVYVDLFKKIYVKPNKPYIFTYILDDNKENHESIENFSRQRNMSVVNIKAQTGDISTLHIIEPVEKWLSAIYYADYVITDSFHGTVFSLIFNKQFVVYGNVQRGLSRMQDLLYHVGLTDRLITSKVDIGKILMHEINWDSVNNCISGYKDSSMLFLKNTLLQC